MTIKRGPGRNLADHRKRQLGAIHVRAKQLRLERETYVALLQRVAGVDSAAKLSGRGRAQVLDELKRLAGDSAAHMRRAVPPPGAPEVRDELAAMVAKIGAMLAEGGKSWPYAQAIAKRMFHVDQVEWLSAEQMHRLVAALSYDQRRQRAKVRTHA